MVIPGPPMRNAGFSNSDISGIRLDPELAGELPE